MTFDWADWGPPLAVLAFGLVAGGFVAARSRATAADRRRIEDEGRTADLHHDKDSVLEALEALETERNKLEPDEYERERKALIARGAAALRGLDASPASPSSTPDASLAQTDEAVELLAELLRAEKARLGEETFHAALARVTDARPPAPTEGLSPQWQGAMTTMLVFAVIGGLWWAAGSDSTMRGDGGMTGRGSGSAQMAGGAGAPAAAQAPSSPAKTELEARLAANPSDLDALNQLTDMSLAAEDLPGAMNYNAKALEVAPADPDARVNRAALQVSIGMRDKALVTLDEVIAENPTHIKALVYRGLIAMRVGEYQTAVTSLQAAVDAGAEDPFIAERLVEAKRSLETGAPPPLPSGAAAPPPPASPAAAGDLLVSGTVELPAELQGQLSGSETLFVGVKNPAMPGPPLAALKLPARFPATFQVTTADVLPMHRGQPLPTSILVTFQIDRDGNAMTKDDNLATASLADVAAGTADLIVTLAP